MKQRLVKTHFGFHNAFNIEWNWLYRLNAAKTFRLILNNNGILKLADKLANALEKYNRHNILQYTENGFYSSPGLQQN